MGLEPCDASGEAIGGEPPDMRSNPELGCCWCWCWSNCILTFGTGKVGAVAVAAVAVAARVDAGAVAGGGAGIDCEGFSALLDRLGSRGLSAGPDPPWLDALLALVGACAADVRVCRPAGASMETENRVRGPTEKSPTPRPPGALPDGTTVMRCMMMDSAVT
jgi:hypothetical protein